MAKTCATCEHWGGRYSETTERSGECPKLYKELYVASNYAIETPHDFGCVLHDEMVGDG